MERTDGPGRAPPAGERLSPDESRQVLDAAEQAFLRDGRIDDLTIEYVARRSAVSEDAILSRFGDVAGLLSAVAGRLSARIAEQRGAAERGDIEGGVRILIDHYEEVGDAVLRMLRGADDDPTQRGMAEMGRAYHREWCERVFAPALEELDGAERMRRLSQLVAVTDIQTWKLLRRDSALSLRQTEIAMRELVEATTDLAT